MIEITTVIGCFGAVVVAFAGAISALWYKMGKLETKIDLIYKNINIAVDWINGKK